MSMIDNKDKKYKLIKKKYRWIELFLGLFLGDLILKIKPSCQLEEWMKVLKASPDWENIRIFFLFIRYEVTNFRSHQHIKKQSSRCTAPWVLW